MHNHELEHVLGLVVHEIGVILELADHDSDDAQTLRIFAIVAVELGQQYQHLGISLGIAASS